MSEYIDIRQLMGGGYEISRHVSTSSKAKRTHLATTCGGNMGKQLAVVIVQQAKAAFLIDEHRYSWQHDTGRRDSPTEHTLYEALG